MRVAPPGRRRAGACQLTCCPRGARQPCQRARPRFADAAAPSTKRQMSNRQRRRALARAGAWVRLSRSWFGGLVKAAMRAAERGPNGRGRVAASRSIQRAATRQRVVAATGAHPDRQTESGVKQRISYYRLRDRAFLDPSPLRRGCPSACYRQSRPAKWHIRGFALARHLKAVDDRRRGILEK